MRSELDVNRGRRSCLPIDTGERLDDLSSRAAGLHVAARSRRPQGGPVPHTPQRRPRLGDQNSAPTGAHPRGVFTVTRQGHPYIPAVVRRRCAIAPADRLLIAAEPTERRLVIHPPAALDVRASPGYIAVLAGLGVFGPAPPAFLHGPLVMRPRRRRAVIPSQVPTSGVPCG